MKRKIKVCFFGLYDPLYNRYKVIIEGLKAHKIDFYECSLNKNYGSYIKNLVVGNFYLANKYLNTKKDFTHIIIWGDRATVFLGWVVSKLWQKTLIFDPVISTYSTEVEEKKAITPDSLKGKMLFLYEKLVYRLPDYIFAPTKDFKHHFCKLFSLKSDKVFVLPVSAVLKELKETSLNKRKSSFVVLYWGKMLPQHGVEYIIYAAKLLENVEKKVTFRIIGTGYCKEGIKDLSKKLRISNVTFTDYLPADKLQEEIIKADLVLGFFGSSKRANISVGNKVFEALSYGKPVITGKSQANTRFFAHRKEIFFVEPANEKQIADGIMKLYKDPVLRETIASGGYKKMKKDFSEEKIAEKMIEIISNI